MPRRRRRSVGVRPATVVTPFERLLVAEQGDHAQKLSAVMGAVSHEVE